ncbi:unnamed protein product [Blepharisma stoltei]|uniref:Uncharacterized protein n=1 Tax=Blepharisma stoltei TaxID=1481888 RepID=A0AAU9J2H6_9CILI|nr:unnamed protein product [Blepharisma stoltei]
MQDMSEEIEDYNYNQEAMEFTSITVFPLKRKRETSSSGYSSARFAEKIPEDYICKICSDVVKHPVECALCGTLLCEDCTAKPINRNCTVFSTLDFERRPACPVCSTINTMRKPSRVLRRMISELKICCKNRKRGCEFITTLDLLESHESLCSYKVIKCGNSKFCGIKGTIHNFIPLDPAFIRTNSMIREGSGYVCSEVCKREVIFDRLIHSSYIQEALLDYFQVVSEIDERKRSIN